MKKNSISKTSYHLSNKITNCKTNWKRKCNLQNKNYARSKNYLHPALVQIFIEHYLKEWSTTKKIPATVIDFKNKISNSNFF